MRALAMLLVKFLNLYLTASHWFKSFVVNKLFVNLSTVSKSQIGIVASQHIYLSPDFVQQCMGALQFFIV